jgi:hypothetical protein
MEHRVKTVHTFEVAAVCPVNGEEDRYACRVTLYDEVTPCEGLLANAQEEIAREPAAYQEVLTQRLADRLGAKVRTEGSHLGGRVGTVCTCRPAGWE